MKYYFSKVLEEQIGGARQCSAKHGGAGRLAESCETRQRTAKLDGSHQSLKELDEAQRCSAGFGKARQGLGAAQWSSAKLGEAR